jgi:acetylornithine deacetylase/succinyl-diaminopimelate desuccinylase-like protein
MNATDTIIDFYLSEHLDEYVIETSELCAQPSISATGEGVAECADLVETMLERRQFAVNKIPTAGNPVIVARASGESPRTLLFYNHYDVQPPEPLELWTTPPFKPTVRKGALYARGAVDDKGELVARLAAVDAVRAANDGRLPCGITFVVEGEEEIGSPHIAQFVQEHKELLACQGAVWEQGYVDGDGHPINTLGVRGILAVELRVETMTVDAHSGGAHMLPNAAWRLVRVLDSLKGTDERVRIPGFYDDALPPSELEEQLFDAMPNPEAMLREEYGVDEFVLGMTGTELERAVFSPTCNIQGITTGYQGGGMKTVIPHDAAVKMDFRLVPFQDPDDIFAKLRAYLDAQGFADVELRRLGAMWPAKTQLDDPLVQLCIRTGGEVYEKEPVVHPLVGGSSPIYAFAQPLGGIPVIRPGVGHMGCRTHAPDEHVRIENFHNAARHIARILEEYGDL